MEVLKSLGVDSTIWIQLACFIVSYLALSHLVLKPYMRAFHERENRTIGGEETAVRIIEETQVLHTELETRSRALHAKIKGFYDESRTEAMKEYEQLVGRARGDANNLLKISRLEIETQIRTARKALTTEVPHIASAIASKVAGKEFST
jgi:F0F1-type ATP synthase membrane subunit b/b'